MVLPGGPDEEHDQVFMTGPRLAARLRDNMGSFFVGCTECSSMLVLADADGPGRARRAGWMLLPSGWRCPKHADPLGGELIAEPPAAEVTR